MSKRSRSNSPNIRKGVRGHVRMLANLSAIVQFLPEDLSGFFARPWAAAGRSAGAAERAGGARHRGGRGRDRHLFRGGRDPPLETFHYRYDNLVVVVRPDHPLAGRDRLAFVETLDFDHIGLHAASSIYLLSQYAADEAGKSMRLRINVPGFDAVCRMVQANMGIGLIPDRAFEVIGARHEPARRSRCATNGRDANSRSRSAIPGSYPAPAA